MKNLRAFISGLTAFSLIWAQSVPVLAQSVSSDMANTIVHAATTIPASIFGQNSAPFATDPFMAKIQAGIQKCILDSGVASVAASNKTPGQIFAESRKKGTKNGKTAKAVSSAAECGNDFETAIDVETVDVCALNCKAPIGLNLNPSKKSYSCPTMKVTTGKKDDGSTETTEVHKPGATKKADKAGDIAKLTANYAQYIRAKAECESDQAKELKKQLALYNCEVGAVNQGIAEAAQSMQSAMTANAGVVEKMVQYETEVKKQIAGIDKILGPDPNNPNNSGSPQMSGLLGLQKQLQQTQRDLTVSNGDLKGKIETLKADYAKNDQQLQIVRLQAVSQCMEGGTSSGISGADALTCYKKGEVALKDGSKDYERDSGGHIVYHKVYGCSVKDYIVTQAAFSQLSQDGSNRNSVTLDQASAREARAESLFNSIAEKIGNSASSVASGATAHTWQEVATYDNSIKNTIAELSSSTPQISQWMDVLGKACFNKGNQVERDLQKPGSQTKDGKYSWYDNNVKLNGEQNQINAVLKNDLATLNSAYSQSMALLSGQHVTINRYNCTQTVPDKMMDCYNTMLTGMQDLLEGNGSNTRSVQQIPGGAMIPPLSIPCKGVNGCVTALSSVRKMEDNLKSQAETSRGDFVTKANHALSQQMDAFTRSLAGPQSIVAKQFAALAAFVGVAPSKQPVKAVSLAPHKNEDGSPGLLEVQEGGTLNDVIASRIGGTDMSDGLKEIMQANTDKLEKSQKKYSDYADKLDEAVGKYNEYAEACTDENAKDNVGNLFTHSCETLQSSIAKSVEGTKDGTTNPLSSVKPISDAIVSFMKKMDKGEFTDSEVEEVDKKISSMEVGTGWKLGTLKQRCGEEFHNKLGTMALQNSESGSKADSANQNR